MPAYENARRAGKTHPGLIEIISKTDPRHRDFPKQYVPNRADRRRVGIGIAKPKRLSARRRPFGSD